ncbi:MAG: hypothetical protein ACRDTC_04340 [Pseudonocardiaceae bacterium]
MSGLGRSRRAWGWHPLVAGSRLVAADLVLQRAVVHRHVERWRVTAGQLRRRWEARAGRVLPRHAFHPAPQVDSAVLVIHRRGAARGCQWG